MPTSSAATARAEPAAPELIVGFSDDTGRLERDATVAEQNGTVVRQLPEIRAAVVTPQADATISELAATLRTQPGVEFVERNHRVHAFRVPDDPGYHELWGLANPGPVSDGEGSDIGAEAAWDTVTGGNVKVAVLDTGIYAEHPDLAANMWTNPADPANGRDDDNNGLVDDVHGADFLNHDADPGDEAGHGTHVAGAIAAAGNNGTGIAGVAWKAQLIDARFLDSRGSGFMGDAAAAIDYAVDHGARVINASWGGPEYSNALYAAIERANLKGVLFITAAGNDGVNTDTEPTYPAAYDLPNTISVASSDRKDDLSGFSNFGALSTDVAAPGDDIYSTVPGFVDSSGYASLSGTSMASAITSGAATLYASRFPQAPASQIRSALLSSADFIPGMEGKTATGGRINVAAALFAQVMGHRTAPDHFGLLSPRGRAAQRFKRARFHWQQAGGPSGISAYRLYVDGKLRRVLRDPDGPNGRTTPTYARLRLRYGRHAWSVRASTFDGNGRWANATATGKSRRSLRIMHKRSQY